MAMGQYGGIMPVKAAQPARPMPAPRAAPGQPPVAQPYNPAARDQQLRAMGSGPPPAAAPVAAPAPMPPVAAPAPSFAATATPTPGIETMTATSAPLETTNPAATPAAPTDMDGWMAARPDHQEFHTAIQNATTPDERHAAARQFADSMRSWADSFRDWRHAGRGADGGDFGDEFDRLGAHDRANAPPPDPALNEDQAAIAEGQRIKRMRQSRTGTI